MKKDNGLEELSFSGHIPMSETAFYILLSLLEELHGYAIMQHVGEITNNRISLGPGTLYGTLSKLEKSGLVSITKEESKRKYYLITNCGRQVLQKEMERIEELFNNGRKALDNGN